MRFPQVGSSWSEKIILIESLKALLSNTGSHQPVVLILCSLVYLNKKKKKKKKLTEMNKI